MHPVIMKVVQMQSVTNIVLFIVTSQYQTLHEGFLEALRTINP
jgi:hypothetical protein